MITSLDFSLDFKFNNIGIKDLFEGITNLTQKTLSLVHETSTTETNIVQVFFIKTDKPVVLTLTKGEVDSQINVNSSAILTDSYDSIIIHNTSLTDTANCLVIYA